MKTKIYLSDIITVLFFHISFIGLPYFPEYNMMKYAIIAIIAIYLSPKLKVLFRKEYWQINLILLLLIVVILVTSYINKNNVESRDVWLAAIIYCAILLEGFWFFQYIGYINILENVINLIYKLTLFYVVITDILIFFAPNLFIQAEGYYFIGNKFSVAYTHLLLIVLFWRKSAQINLKLHSNNKYFMALLFACTIIISVFVSSASGIVGSFFLLLFIIFNKKIINVITKPLSPVLTLLFSCSFLFLFDAILNSPLVKFIIEYILGRDSTLTGRMWIYDNVFNILPGHIWTGYGHGSTYEICKKLLGVSNTQNGLIEIQVQYGILGVLLVILLIYHVFKYNRKFQNSMSNMPFMGLIYMYILLASIEITISLEFFILLSLVTISSKAKNENSNSQIMGERSCKN